MLFWVIVSWINDNKTYVFIEKYYEEGIDDEKVLI